MPFRSLRIPDYDYGRPGAYFVTFRTARGRRILGYSTQNSLRLTPEGLIVEEVWNSLPSFFAGFRQDAFVVMPNHVHAIIILAEAPGPRISLSDIVRIMKSLSARRINARNGATGRPVWQRGYYERVIRSSRDLRMVRAYVAANPRRWILREGRSRRDHGR